MNSDGLRELLALIAQPDGASGAVLARELGITRAAVWKRVERLRAFGLAIDARAGRGYRLATALDWLDGAEILAGLPLDMHQRIGTLEVHFTLDSTSSEWLRRASELPDASVCLAEAQTSGRGQRGRAWHTPLGAGVALSVLRRFDTGLASLAGLSLVVGVAVRRALAGLGFDIGLKWPNDLQHRRRKLGGILIEASGEISGPCTVVVGLGLNHRLPDQSAAAIDQAHVDLAGMAEEAGILLPDRNTLVAALIEQCLRALNEFERTGLASVLPEWRSADVLLGQPLTLTTSTSVLQGIGAGVDESGCLLVQADGGVRACASGTASARARA